MYLNKLLIILLLSSSVVFANAIIITNKNFKDTLTINDVKSIFLGKKTRLSDQTLLYPAYLETLDESTLSFFTQVIKKPYRKFNKYWIKRVFSGHGVPPKRLKNIGQLLKYVSENKGAIAIVSNKVKLDGDIKVLPLSW